MKPLPGQKELPLVIDHRKTFYDFIKDTNGGKMKSAEENQSVKLARLFLKYDEKPTSEMWIEILRLSRELVK